MEFHQGPKRSQAPTERAWNGPRRCPSGSSSWSSWCMGGTGQQQQGSHSATRRPRPTWGWPRAGSCSSRSIAGPAGPSGMRLRCRATLDRSIASSPSWAGIPAGGVLPGRPAGETGEEGRSPIQRRQRTAVARNAGCVGQPTGLAPDASVPASGSGVKSPPMPVSRVTANGGSASSRRVPLRAGTG